MVYDRGNGEVLGEEPLRLDLKSWKSKTSKKPVDYVDDQGFETDRNLSETPSNVETSLLKVTTHENKVTKQLLIKLKKLHDGNKLQSNR